jgi:uncharacterized protein (TIGR02145 family)
MKRIILSFLVLLTACDKEESASLTTPKADFVTQSTAVVTFEITDEGTQSVLDQGICWSENPIPTVEDQHIEDNMVKREFYRNGLAGLAPNTTYYVRGYAKSGAGVGYSPEITLRTLPTVFLEDTRDGKRYPTVKIGSQTWMAKNLDYATTTGTAVYFNNDSQYAAYGRLYDWETACKVCPSGWHLPSDAEWQQLEVVAGIPANQVNETGSRGADIGTQLKEPGNMNWDEMRTVSSTITNKLGLTVQPTGSFSAKETLEKTHLKRFAYLWTSKSATSNEAWARQFRYLNNEVVRFYFDKKLGFGVRCVKD